MSFFTEAMRMFAPFAGQGEDQANEGKGEAKAKETKGEKANDIDALKRQMVEMQAKLEALSRK
jgi:polyhydroxyalkanoate synthesis regulator protein